MGLKSKKLGLCSKTRDWNVEFQNARCRRACGEMQGKICKKSCRLWLVEDGALSSNRARIYPFRELNGIRYDVILIPDKKEIATILSPVEDTPGETRDRLLAIGLSPREIEVVLLLKEGNSHQEICHQLNIRRGTLKTHLKKIREKLGRQTAA